jgi:hypothetical protein
MPEIDLDALTPTYIGPTWLQNDCGKWVLPEATLGWEIIGWAGKWLKGEDGKPWKFTKEQLRFVLWWYAVDELGRFVYRKGVLQRMKGWGKDPLLAVLCLVELVGPSRVLPVRRRLLVRRGRRMANGEGPSWRPAGHPGPNAWVQVTAVNQSQTDEHDALHPVADERTS